MFPVALLGFFLERTLEDCTVKHVMSSFASYCVSAHFIYAAENTVSCSELQIYLPTNLVSNYFAGESMMNPHTVLPSTTPTFSALRWCCCWSSAPSYWWCRHRRRRRRYAASATRPSSGRTSPMVLWVMAFVPWPCVFFSLGWSCIDHLSRSLLDCYCVALMLGS